MNDAAELVIFNLMKLFANRDERSLAAFVLCCKRNVCIAKVHGMYARNIAAQRIGAVWRRFRKFGGKTFASLSEALNHELSCEGNREEVLQLYMRIVRRSREKCGLNFDGGIIDFSLARTAWLNAHLHTRSLSKVVAITESSHTNDMREWTIPRNCGDVVRTISVLSDATPENPLTLCITIVRVAANADGDDYQCRRVEIKSRYYVWLVNLPMIGVSFVDDVVVRNVSSTPSSFSVVGLRCAWLNGFTGSVRDLLLSRRVKL